MKRIFQTIKHLWQGETFSPEAFVVRSVILSLLYAVSRILGLQTYTTFLSGTSANVNLSFQTAAALGLIHLVLYVAFILLVPILLIAAALLAAWNRWNPPVASMDSRPGRETAGHRSGCRG